MKIKAHALFTVSASESERTGRKRVYPHAVEYDDWAEAANAIHRVIAAGFVAIVDRDVVEGTDATQDDPDLNDWPAARHICSAEEYWRRYAVDNPEFARRIEAKSS